MNDLEALLAVQSGQGLKTTLKILEKNKELNSGQRVHIAPPSPLNNPELFTFMGHVLNITRVICTRCEQSYEYPEEYYGVYQNNLRKFVDKRPTSYSPQHNPSKQVTERKICVCQFCMGV